MPKPDFRSLEDFGSLKPTAMTAGHKKALELIAENKRTRSPFLDLGNLGLTEVPGQISEVFKTSEILTLSPLP